MDDFSPAHQNYISSVSWNNADVFIDKKYTVYKFNHSYMYKATKFPALSSSKSKSWLNKREFKRRKRMGKYKWYIVEGKAKNSVKKGVRWLKRTWSKIKYGF